MNLRTFLILSLLLASPALAQDPPTDAPGRIAEIFTGARLEGKFNIVGPDGMSAPQADLYMVSELEHDEDGRWVFRYRMGKDARDMAPIPVDISWAGDTPVLAVSEQSIAGLEGVFSARVMVHGDRYAGTWQHGPIGGHMWGLLVRDEGSAESD